MSYDFQYSVGSLSHILIIIIRTSTLLKIFLPVLGQFVNCLVK